MAVARTRRGVFGLGLASFAADTRQSSVEKAGGDIDFAAFYILPVPSSLSAKWRRVEIGSLPSFSLALAFASGRLVHRTSHRKAAVMSLRIAPKHPLRSRAAHLHPA